MYAVVAFVLTHLPGGSVPKVSWAEMIPAADKIVHAGLYFLLGALLANCLRFWLRSNRVIVLLTLGTLAAYAAFDEWSQQFSPHRSPDLLDFVADMLGAACGVSLFAVWRWLRRQKRETPNHSAADNAPGSGDTRPVEPPVASAEIGEEPAACPNGADRPQVTWSMDSPSRERECETAGQTRVTV